MSELTAADQGWPTSLRPRPNQSDVHLYNRAVRVLPDSTGVAIIGVAHRLPGHDREAEPSATFWEQLLAGRDLVTTVPASRWPAHTYLHPRKSEPGTSYTFAAGSIGDVYGFEDRKSVV